LHSSPAGGPLILLALATLASAADRLHARLDVGLGAAAEGGLAVRVGVAPELWWERLAAGVRLSFDGDLSPGILSGELNFARVEPYILVEPFPHGVVGLGVGGAWATHHPGFLSGADAVHRPVTTASAVAGWVSSRRWFSAWVRLDASSWPSAAATFEIGLAPGVPLHRE
jgi:hypothetical protein